MEGRSACWQSGSDWYQDRLEYLELVSERVEAGADCRGDCLRHLRRHCVLKDRRSIHTDSRSMPAGTGDASPHLLRAIQSMFVRTQKSQLFPYVREEIQIRVLSQYPQVQTYHGLDLGYIYTGQKGIVLPCTIQAHTVHKSIHVSASSTHPSESVLTMLKPSTMLHQNNTLLSNFLFLIYGVLCTSTIGICSIMAMKPYPRNLRVIQPMTSSWANELIKNVMKVATGRDMVVREALYTCRLKKLCTGMFHSRLNVSQSCEFHHAV